MAKRIIPDKPTHGFAVPGHPNLQWWGPHCYIRARITVPADVREQIGKRELVKGLGTQCISEAVRRSHAPLADFERRIAAARLAAGKKTSRVYISTQPLAAFQQTIGNGPFPADDAYTTMYMPMPRDTTGFYRMIGGVASMPYDHPMIRLGNPADFAKEDAMPLAGFTWQAGIEEWIKSKGTAPPARETVDVYRGHLRRFFESLGHDEMSRVTEQDIVDHPAVLLTGSDGKKKVENKSVNNHMASIRAVFRKAKEKKKITSDPTVGNVHKLATRRKSDPRNRKGFERDQHAAIITKLLTLPHDDPRRWLWLLGAIYGGRVGEFADASVAAVHLVYGRLCLDINEEYRNTWQGKPVTIDGEEYNPWQGESLRIKTDGSMRILPLTTAFDRFGFIDHVERIISTIGPDAPLFPSIPVNQYGKRAQDASRQCNDWLRKEVGIKDKRLVFHSTRHTVKTFLRGRVEQDVSDAITGHDDGSVSFHYGETELAVIAEAIETHIPVA
jgi:integrase